MQDTSHLVALHSHLMHERRRLADAKTAHERNIRSVGVAQLEREVAKEEEFLGIPHVNCGVMNVDDLASELGEYA